MVKRIFISLCLIFTVNQTVAQWYTGEGQAYITDGNIQEARELAIRDALLSVMYQGGASVNAVRVVNQGVLEKHKLSVRTKGEVHDMRLLKEAIVDDTLIVTVSADISTNQCAPDNYAKTLFIGPLQLQKREHGQLGGIYRVPEELTRRLFYRFKENSQFIDVRHLRTRQIAFDDSYDNDMERQMLSVANDISNQYDVQYVLFGKISDMSSFNETETELLVFDTDVKHRNYQVRLYVIDGIKGVTVFRKNYSGRAQWPFDVTMKLDVTGNIFWTSEYGKLIDNLLEESVVDIQKTLGCEQSIATVKNIYNDKIMINLGQVNGINRGDTFKLIRQKYIYEQPNNRMQEIFNPSEIEFSVTHVQSDRSILTTTNETGMENIQIRDRLVATDGLMLDKTVYQY